MSKSPEKVCLYVKGRYGVFKNRPKFSWKFFLLITVFNSIYPVLPREWTDGLFTHILRKIIDNVRGELDKRQWIIFDGDVDPVWIENLNRDVYI